MKKHIVAAEAALKKYDSRIRLTSGFIIASSLFIMLATLFVKLAREVREQNTAEFDRQVLLWINSGSVSWLDGVMPVLTNLGGFIGVIAATAIAIGLLVLRRRYRLMTLVAISVGGAAVLNITLKAIFERQRPDLWVQLVHESGYSFPSGHAMASAALAFAVIAITWRRPGWHTWMIALMAAYITFVGFSRMYLGVHYPSDIVAGWLVSGAWVAVVTLILNTKLGRRTISNTDRRAVHLD